MINSNNNSAECIKQISLIVQILKSFLQLFLPYFFPAEIPVVKYFNITQKVIYLLSYALLFFKIFEFKL